MRVYEPLVAFHEPQRSRWRAYVASPARPRRCDALAAEWHEAMTRLVSGLGPASPGPGPLGGSVVPDRESRDAYVRRIGGEAYVCPWQTRLRCLLARAELPARGDRTYIRSSRWSVPVEWLVPFAAEERWLMLGLGRDPDDGADLAGSLLAAPPGRAVVYLTEMLAARRRISRGRAAVRMLGQERRRSAGAGVSEAVLSQLASWLELFHPGSLVELDYGGLVHLLSDDELRHDDSVAEVAVAMEAIMRDRRDVAVRMLARVAGRWRRLSELERAN